MATIASEDQDPEAGLRPKKGGKLNRSETVTVRLDPRLNYLCELAARAQRRTKSSFIEWAVEKALSAVPIPGTGNWDSDDKSIENLAATLWDVDEPDRLVALAFHAPILMTHEEQLIWKVIKEYGLVWLGGYGPYIEGYEKWTWKTTPDKIVMADVRKHFDKIKEVALEGASAAETLPIYSNTRKKPAAKAVGDSVDALDDDIPF